jgi:hypothetical protein
VFDSGPGAVRVGTDHARYRWGGMRHAAMRRPLASGLHRRIPSVPTFPSRCTDEPQQQTGLNRRVHAAGFRAVRTRVSG